MSRKPFVSVNMASSIDGKVATHLRGSVKLGSSFDSRRMAEIRADHDIILMGAETFRAHPVTLTVGSKDLRVKRKQKKRSEQPATAIVSSKAQIPRITSWLKDHKVERWLFCGSKAPERRLQNFMLDGVRVAQDFRERPDPFRILGRLERCGHERVLLEGGGEMNATFFEQDLVDRIYLTLCPILIGSRQAPTIFDGEGFGPSGLSCWKLREKKLHSGELYLVFDRNKRSWKRLAGA